MAEFHICPDCEQPTATEPASLCPACAKWRGEKFSAMDEDYRDKQRRRERILGQRGLTPSQKFAEDLSDLVQAVERSR